MGAVQWLRSEFRSNDRRHETPVLEVGRAVIAECERLRRAGRVCHSYVQCSLPFAFYAFDHAWPRVWRVVGPTTHSCLKNG